ncbi:MAG: tRNA-specific 2-thiouridylase MnmA [Actinobacteria bacterium]|nr:tRNA-specific 2-thiouridylase MnmA [Actinomycetota bacterium]
MCNKEIKFGLFLEKVLGMGADYVATGHYIRLQREFSIINFQFTNKSKIKKFENLNTENSLKIENYKLKIAKDINKDQSYFLWTLTQEQLKHCLFPIGDYLKSEVREIAKKAGLPTAEKKDSQGICFLGMVKFKDFLKQYLLVKNGAVLNIDGKKIGEHDGVWFYTIGQRHIGSNFQFPLLPRANPRRVFSNFQKNRKPYYIAEKNIKKNIIVVAEGDNNPALYKKEIQLMDVNFINQNCYSLIRANKRITIYVRVRYRQPLAKAELYKLKANSYKLIFDTPVKSVAPGQSAVFYNSKGEMLGGGIII